MNDIINEINQELREERGKALWKKYGVYVIGFAIAVVVMVSGRQGLVAYQDNQRINAANAYFSAVSSDSSDALAALSSQTGEGYPLLARFAEASRLVEEGSSEAESAYLAIAQDDSINALYRDVATVMSVMNAAPATGVQDKLNRIAGLAAEEGPWQQVAIEMMIGLYVEKGDLAEARNQLSALRFGQGLTAEANQRILLLEAALAE